jgi:hypothetical protein
MKNTIEIEWLEDSSECDTCGYNYASGAIVKINGEKIIELIPHAHCYGGSTWEQYDVYRFIFEHLGYEVKEE